MKNLLIASGAIILIVLFGMFFISDPIDDSFPTDEPISQKIIYVAQGNFLERDGFGRVTFNPAGVDPSVVFTFEDFDAILESKRIEAGSALALNRGNVEHLGQEVIFNLIGITNGSFPYVFDYQVQDGRFFTDDESDKVVVVGQRLKQELEEKGVSQVIGQVLNVRGTDFEIVGILEEIDTGNEAADADLNKLLLVPRQHIDLIIDNLANPFVEELRFIANNSQTMGPTVKEIEESLLRTRGQQDFTVLRPEELAALGINVIDTD